MGIKRKSLFGGEKFSRLTVVKLDHVTIRANGKKGERVMVCICECGNTLKVRTSNLYSGNTQSCGCFHSQQTVKSNVSRKCIA